MFQKMMTGALIAGVAVGLLAAVQHFAFIQNTVLLGEDHESGALVHVAAAPEAADHDHGTVFSARALSVGLAVRVAMGWVAGRHLQRGAA